MKAQSIKLLCPEIVMLSVSDCFITLLVHYIMPHNSTCLAAIVEDVKAGTDPLCRPHPPGNIGKLKVDNKAIHLMEDCWFEDPSGRPSFANIKQRLKVFNKGK